MMNELVTLAQMFALNAGAEFAVLPAPTMTKGGVDPSLDKLSEALAERLAAAGADLVGLSRQGDLLVATVNEGRADLPVCPAAFRQVVRKLSYDLLGEALDGRLAIEPSVAVRLQHRRRGARRATRPRAV